MKAGRNDPCPCGSGKKYKKCCLAKDQEESSRQVTLSQPSPSLVAPFRTGPSLPEQHAQLDVPIAAARDEETTVPAPLRDPADEKAESYWREFESQVGDDRIAVFLKALEDDEVMDDELAFEMLRILREEAVKRGGRTRFAEHVRLLRERLPEVFDQSAHYYLSWCLLDALVENRQEVLSSLAWDLAAHAGRDIDTDNRAMDYLRYYGQLDVLVGAMRNAWPAVKSSDNIIMWGVTEFAEKAVRLEIFDYLEHTTSPDPADAALLDRVRYFIEDPREDFVGELVGDLTGRSGREWQADDFGLRPQKGSRDDWDAEGEDEESQDQGALNLFRLITEFVGYLRREEGVPFPRGDQVSQELYRYFVGRNDGDLDPRPSMLEQAMHPKRKLPKPPRPAHPLCPERVTLDVHLARLMD
jgi:SEC-C motif